MPKYSQITSEPGKFSERFIPTHPGGSHKMACCDCGLIHDMKFTAWMKVPGGYKKLSSRAAVVMIQARRNNKATYRRRHSKKKHRATVKT